GDFNGADSFVITVSDGFGGVVPLKVNMSVTPVADIADDAASTNERTPVVIDVNANDTFENGGHAVTGIDGAPVTVGTPVAVANGTVTLNADGTLSFTPNADFTGNTSFTYTVSSGGVTEQATVVVNVVDVNEPPVPKDPGGVPGQQFDPDSGDYRISLPQDSQFDGRVGGGDPDGDELSYAVGTPPSHGSVTLDADGRYVYTPNPGYHGSDSFVVRISDGKGGFTTSTVFITVTPVLAQAPQPTVRDDFPFVFEPEPIVHDNRHWDGARIEVDPTVLQAVNGARSLQGTTTLTGALPAVLQSANGVDSLNGTPVLGVGGVVLQAVNGVFPLGGSASYDRVGGDLGRDDSGADKGSSLHTTSGMQIELSAHRQDVRISLSRGPGVREVRATLPDGRALPSWVHLDPSGLLMIERPLDVEQLRLRLTTVPEHGPARSRVIEIDFNSGQMREVNDRQPRAKPAAGSGPRAQLGVPDFLAQLETATRPRAGVDAQLLELLAVLDEPA
ncbi:MAG: tandem-95 repeat protein, partial [Proteobacteria bacterium]|nr:tandem-95 repeat protein [Pseudomonadota bacterium]